MPAAERRQLTVLFCDVVGSTTLSTRLDPEDLSDVIRHYHRACAAAVSRFGGFVAQYMGDGVLAYFGYPQAHEDDAERAVRSGLALLEAVDKLSSRFDFAPQVRVGIATGLVVVGRLIGDGAVQEHAAMGETPNLAARLQALAAPNTIVIAPTTRRLTGRLFESRSLGSLTIKGFDAPMPVFQVVGPSSVQSRFEALREAELTPLVGREEELALLSEQWERVGKGEGRVVVLVGEPGIGKSRIAREFEERLVGTSYTGVRFFCSPHHQDSALFPLVSYFERAADFSREDPADAKLGKVEALLARASTEPEAIGLIADLLSLPIAGRYPLPQLSPQRRKEKMLEALFAHVAWLAAQQPLLMLFEDVHWIDPTSLELLALTVERVSQLRICVIVTARPEFVVPWPGDAPLMVMPLTRLNQREGTALVDRVTGGKVLPDEVLAQILDRTDGVPLFVEELTKAVVESGLLQENHGRYALSAPLPEQGIPTTLQDSLLARLNRRPMVREVAQVGAAIGREFSYPLLSAVAGLATDQLGEALDELVRSELVSAHGEPPQAVYNFKHTLVRDAAYDTLLRTRRHELHARITAVLEQRFPQVVEQHPELLAQHSTAAGLTELAIAYWGKAGRRSIARSALIEAVAQLRKGLALVRSLPDNLERWQREFDLQSALAGALVASQGGGSRDAGDAYARARVLSDRLGNTAAMVPLLAGQHWNHIARCEYAAAREIAEELLRLGQSRNDATASLVGTRSMATCFHFAGAFAPAAEYYARVLSLYVPQKHSPKILAGSVILPVSPMADSAIASVVGFDMRVQALMDSSWDLLILGHPDRALSHLEEGLTWSRQLQHYHSLALALVNGAKFHVLHRTERAALAMLDEAIAVATEQRFRHWLARATIVRGYVLSACGEAPRGLALARKGLADHAAVFAGSSTTGVVPNHTYYLSLFAQSCERAGHVDEALDALAAALNTANMTGERWFEAEIYRLKGEWGLAHGRESPSQAEADFSRAMAVAREQNAKLWQLRAAVSLSRLWRRQGKHTEARELLVPLYGWFTEGLGTSDLEDARLLLTELSNPPGASSAAFGGPATG